MKNISPLDIYNHDFSKATFGGYKAEEVEDFLDEVGSAYEKLLKEINSLKNDKSKLQEKLDNYESIQNKLTETLESVRETAREQTEQARREAKMIIEKAEAEADKIKEEARNNVHEEYKKLKQLQEARKLFRIRYKNLLESHLQMLEDNEEELEEVEPAENGLDE